MRTEMREGLGKIFRGAVVSGIGVAEMRALRPMTDLPYEMVTFWVPDHPVFNFLKNVGKHALDNLLGAGVYNAVGRFVTKGALRDVEREHVAAAVGVDVTKDVIRPLSTRPDLLGQLTNRTLSLFELGNSVSLRGGQTFFEGLKDIYHSFTRKNPQTA